MRMQLLSAVAVALLVNTGAIANDLMTLNPFPHRVEPVLVQVNADGKVTEVSPAYSLPPKMSHLLNTNLDEMIHAPATDKNGKPIPSQFVMNVALQAEPNGAGNYNAHFAYVSTNPVPPGNWYWVHLDGDRLALASRDFFPSGRRFMHMDHYRGDFPPNYRSTNRSSPATAAKPPVQNSTFNSPNTSNTSPSSSQPSHTR